CDAVSSIASSPGYNGNVASSSAGSTTLRTSSALSSSPASLSSSDDFEIGSSYFESKGDLYAEAVTQILNEKQLLSSDGVSIDPRAVDSAAQFVRDYLSREHFEDIDGTCPLIAFPTDFLREEHRVRQAFETVLRVMIDVFEQALRRNGQAARSR